MLFLILGIILLILMATYLTSNRIDDETKAVIDDINQVVSSEDYSMEEITNVISEYELLTDKQKEKVDNYDKLLSAVSNDPNTIKNYYHAIYGARDYANTYSLTGDFATGWYLPTVDEWNTATENIAEIRSSLEKVGGDGIEKASNNVNKKYWTCNTTSTNYATQFTPATRTPTDNAGRTGSAYIRAFRLFRK